jgi:hypothetical protein
MQRNSSSKLRSNQLAKVKRKRVENSARKKVTLLSKLKKNLENNSFCCRKSTNYYLAVP